MSIIIGSARLAENGSITGGAVGDQKQRSTPDYTGEVSMQAFYQHSKGWYILRPKDAAHANAIARKMKDACNNPNLGYDQTGRYGVLTYGIGTKTKTECDCSSLVRACVKEATGKDPGEFSTAVEATVLENSGLFEKRIPYSSGTALYTGDVLVTKTKGHTVIVTDGNPRFAGKYKGKVTASELNVRSAAGTENKVLFVLKNGEKVTVCGSVNAKDGSTWLQIRKGKKSGFVSGKYITKA